MEAAATAAAAAAGAATQGNFHIERPIKQACQTLMPTQHGSRGVLPDTAPAPGVLLPSSSLYIHISLRASDQTPNLQQQ